ncbi:MAG: hypothetical protein ACPGTO_09040 [Polaribacter sp.]
MSKNWTNIEGKRALEQVPYLSIDHSNYIQWDGVHYKNIKEHGYDVEKIGGDYIFAFFPLFPAIWSLFSLPPIGVVFLNYFLFSLAIVLLIKVFSPKDHDNIAVVLALPVLVSFLIPYTESVFFITIALGFIGYRKQIYWLYFLGFLLAALTRPTFTFLFLSIVVVECLKFLENRDGLEFIKQSTLRLLPLILGTLMVSLIQLYYSSGSLVKFIEVQEYWGHKLAIPHHLRDWSHESFGMNLAVVFLIAVPLLVVLVMFAKTVLPQWFKKSKPNRTKKSLVSQYYLEILSATYIVGVFVFVLLFRGGSLHGLYRFIVCTPFFIILILSKNVRELLQSISVNVRLFMVGTFSLFALLMLGLTDYSTYWNFSDLGMILMIASLCLWLFKDDLSKKAFAILACGNILINALWTSYLFNMYLSNGWIFT